MKNQFICVVVLLAGWVGQVFSQDDQVCRLEKLVIATGIELKEPTGVAQEFDASVGKVYCWVRMACRDLPKTVKQVWYLEDEKQLEVALTIKFPSMRTWSNKNIRPGNWKVQVLDADQSVLGEAKFIVR